MDFVGSHLVEVLVDCGCRVTVLDDLSSGKLEYLNLKMVQFLKHDVANHQFVLDDCFDVVFHLAAKPFSKTENDWLAESRSIFRTNATGTHNVLRLTKPDCHFVLVSSASVYGEDRYIPESNPYDPKSAYGYSKVLAEQVVLNSGRKNVTVIRPATIIGTRGRCFPNRVMWSIVHNSECNFFKDGKVVRDIIDVRDMTTALKKIMEQKAYGIYNLGTNIETKGEQLFKIAKQMAEENNLTFNGKTIPFVPKDFVVNSSLNSTKLHNKINWNPIFTLKESLKDIFNYYNLQSDVTEPPSWESAS